MILTWKVPWSILIEGTADICSSCRSANLLPNCEKKNIFTTLLRCQAGGQAGVTGSSWLISKLVRVCLCLSLPPSPQLHRGGGLPACDCSALGNRTAHAFWMLATDTSHCSLTCTEVLSQSNPWGLSFSRDCFLQSVYYSMRSFCKDLCKYQLCFACQWRDELLTQMLGLCSTNMYLLTHFMDR